MAPVAPSWLRERSRRAQLILVGGLALAVALVALALILNTAIYTENLASRNDDAIVGDAVGFQGAMRGEVVRLMDEAVERHPDSNPDQTGFVVDGVDSLGAATPAYAASDGVAASVTFAGATPGSRLFDDDPTTTFEADEDGDSAVDRDWTVAASVDVSREFSVTVRRSTLADGSDPTFAPGDALAFVFDGSDAATVQLFRDGSGVTVVRIVTPSGTAVCRDATGSTTTIDVTGATVGGRPCPALRFFETVGSPYDISVANGHRGAGTFGVVVPDSAAVPSDPYDESGPPDRRERLYATFVEVGYRTGGVSYVTGLRVAPGEHDV